MKVQLLKTWPAYFDAVDQGAKRFEVRRDDGRGFDQGDVAMLMEWLPEEERYSGRCRMFKIGYVAKLSNLDPELGNLVGFQLEEITWDPDRYESDKRTILVPEVPGVVVGSHFMPDPDRPQVSEPMDWFVGGGLPSGDGDLISMTRAEALGVYHAGVDRVESSLEASKHFPSITRRNRAVKTFERLREFIWPPERSVIGHE